MCREGLREAGGSLGSDSHREWLYTCHERQAFKLAVDNLRDFVLFLPIHFPYLFICFGLLRQGFTV